jgi:hypothetical protein
MHGFSRMLVAAVLMAAGTAPAVGVAPSFAGDRPVSVWMVQAPDAGLAPYEFDRPPRQQEAPDTSIPPLNRPLGPEELQRAEALLPLLEGKQEFWAMGEFVHLGKPVVPVLTKALTMSSPRIRYNAIETLLLIKDPGAVPALVSVAQDRSEMPRIREHALRVAVRLDPAQAPPAIEAMAKDEESVIRKVAAFEARYVRQKSVVQPLIDLLADEERFVSITAIQSLWMLTRHESEMHNWEASTKEEREEWAKEWADWWREDRETFQMPDPRKPRRPLPQN